MNENLKSIGISNPQDIERYTLRQDANRDVLIIYFHKIKGAFFARSIKFNFPRQRKTVLVDGGTASYKHTSEINANLRFIVEELDQITQHEQQEHDAKQQILKELRELEHSLASRIKAIENQLERI